MVICDVVVILISPDPKLGVGLASSCINMQSDARLSDAADKTLQTKH